MKRIMITTAEIRPDEARRIRMALDAGWDAVHLRHPDATITDVRKLIEAIPQRLHGKLHLHGHFALVNEFNLGGLHLNSRCPAPPENYSGPLSLTCHSVEEVAEAAASERFEYVTLSPVFPSLSKPGYGPEKELDMAKLKEVAPQITIVALGGVTPERAAEIDREAFGGYAVLGYLAEAADDEDFQRRLKEYNNL